MLRGALDWKLPVSISVQHLPKKFPRTLEKNRKIASFNTVRPNLKRKVDQVTMICLHISVKRDCRILAPWGLLYIVLTWVRPPFLAHDAVPIQGLGEGMPGTASQKEGMLFYRLDNRVVNGASNAQTKRPMSEKIQTTVAKE
jgi:hypothetical protein